MLTNLALDDRRIEAARRIGRRKAKRELDLLLYAVAERRALPIFTADRDFERYARVLRFPLHAPRAAQS